MTKKPYESSRPSALNLKTGPNKTRRIDHTRFERPAGTLLPSEGGLLAPVELERRSVELRRGLFLSFAGQITPAVLSSLRDGPGRDLKKCGLSRGVLFFDLRRVEREKRFGKLLNRLRRWGRTWNLNDQWCLEWASSTITYWQSNPGAEGWFHSALNKKIELPKLHPSTYDPAVEIWSEYKLRRQQQEETYLQLLEQQIRAAGLIEIKEIRMPFHFAWLAGYQVDTWSRMQIADAEGKAF